MRLKSRLSCPPKRCSFSHCGFAVRVNSIAGFKVPFGFPELKIIPPCSRVSAFCLIQYRIRTSLGVALRESYSSISSPCVRRLLSKPILGRFRSAEGLGGRLGRFTGVGGVCDQLRGWLAQQEINTVGVLSRVRAGNAHEAPFFRPLNNQPPSTLRHLPLAQ